MKQEKPILWSKNLCLITGATFLMFTAFYMLLPIIAMYVVDRFGADASVAGVVVSVYIISALLARPFSGYLVDKYDRKTFYFISYVMFALLCSGYIFVASIAMLIVLRVLLGIVFSFVTTAGSTLSIDLMPAPRRGEGIGYIGAITVLSMAAGPMIGLYLMDIADYEGLFICAAVICFAGVICASFVKTEHRPRVEKAPLSLDRFFLKAATSLGLITALVNFPYGIMMTYIPLYIKEADVNVEAGTFFLYLACGVVTSRLISGKLINRGFQNTLLQIGILGLVISLYMFVYQLNNMTFIISAVITGLSYGLISPSLQSLIINLVPHSKRGTANSTYFIALDLGSGMGMLLGGFIANETSYQTVFMISWAVVMIGFIIYRTYAYRNYMKNLRKTEV